MKSIRNIAVTALITLGAFSLVTYSSCKKDEDSCAVGYTGSNCKTEVRTLYANTYRGDGFDNDGGTYTDWALIFTPLGQAATDMTMTLVDDNNVPQLSFKVHLKTNTTFEVEEKVSGLFTYTGSGSVNENSASLTLHEESSGSTTIFTFNDMIKE